jgi:cysteine desulfurase family protein
VRVGAKRGLSYLDNGATSLPKAPGTARAVAEALADSGNPGRSGHALSVLSARRVFSAREELAALFSFPDSSRFVFTLNTTMALNLAIRGVVAAGDRVVTTSVEHNAVMRPLRRLEGEEGVEVVRVPAGRDGRVDPERMAEAVTEGTRLVVMTHASNVSGALQPVEAVAAAARRKGALFLLDAAQTAGSFPIDLSALPVDLLAAPGHKGLLGPMGTGFLFVRPGVDVAPLVAGGTGSRSEEELHPDFYPDALEAGTPNVPGLAGLAASVSWLRRKGVEKVWQEDVERMAFLRDGMERIPAVRLFGPPDPLLCAPVLSFLVEGQDPGDTARRLEEEGGILVRPGLHCSPAAHRTLGTFPDGTVRVSPGPFTSKAELRNFLAVLRKVAGGRGRAPEA